MLIYFIFLVIVAKKKANLIFVFHIYFAQRGFIVID